MYKHGTNITKKRFQRELRIWFKPGVGNLEPAKQNRPICDMLVRY